MRAGLLSLSLVMWAGCVFSDYAADDAEQALEVAMAVPSGTDTLEFSAYEDASCDALGQLAVGGSVLDDIDGRRFAIGMTEAMPVRPGTFVFEAIALDTSSDPELELAAGCASATIREKQTTTLRIVMVEL